MAVSNMQAALIEWSVYRSLDTRTNARYDHSGETAESRLTRWRAENVSDSQITEELSKIYRYNPSRRADDEPVVVVSADYRSKNKKDGSEKVLALWCSLTDQEPDVRYNPKKRDWTVVSPAVCGGQIVALVRVLMGRSAPPVRP